MNKVVLITGCSSGFGKLTALLFIEKGWIVYGTLRDLSTTTAQELEEAGVKLLYVDLTKEDTIKEAVSQIHKQEKRIDLLINNAGVGFLGPVEEFSSEEIKNQFTVNLFGVHQIIKEVVPIMRSQHQGRIINISSMAARSTTALYGIYSATKVALEAMSEALNLEVSKWNIQVSVIEPGSFATNFGKNIHLPSDLTEKSPYNQLISRYSKLRTELDGTRNTMNSFRNPIRVAKLIYRVATAKRPQFRYVIGIDAFFIILAITFMPYWLRMKILKAFYRW